MQRDTAVARAMEIGAAPAAKELGINPNTVRSWLRRSGLVPPVSERLGQTAAATTAKLKTVAERKAQLADDLLDDAQRLRAQLFAPCTERKAMAISGGLHQRGEIEIVDIERTQPAFVEQKAIMTSIAIAVDKIQILTGEATSIIESITTERPAEVASATILHLVDKLQQQAS